MQEILRNPILYLTNTEKNKLEQNLCWRENEWEKSGGSVDYLLKSAGERGRICNFNQHLYLRGKIVFSDTL